MCVDIEVLGHWWLAKWHFLISDRVTALHVGVGISAVDRLLPPPLAASLVLDIRLQSRCLLSSSQVGSCLTVRCCTTQLRPSI